MIANIDGIASNREPISQKVQFDVTVGRYQSTRLFAIILFLLLFVFTIIFIIIILTFSIKCYKNNEQKKWRHCDGVKCSETNNNGKVSKEEFTNLISKLITGAPMKDRYGCKCWTPKFFFKIFS